MAGKPGSEELMEQILQEVAASASNPEFDDEFLGSFEDLQEGAERPLLPGQLPALLDISTVGFAKANRTCTDRAQAMGAQAGLPPRFPAVRAKFSKKEQSLLCLPHQIHEEGETNIAQVTWSPGGKEMRIDLALILASSGWKIDPGFELRCKVLFLKNHPKIGPAMIIDLKGGTLKDAPSRVRKFNKKKAAKAGGAAANGQEANEAQPEAKPQEGAGQEGKANE